MLHMMNILYFPGTKVKKNLIVRRALIQLALSALYQSTKEENVKNIFTTQGPHPPPHQAHLPGITILLVLMSYDSKINLDCEDHKMVPIALKDKLYTSLESAHLDLHIHLTHCSLF